MKAYQPIVGRIVAERRPRSILDLPGGLGWLPAQIAMRGVAIDGIDLYESHPAGYRNFLQRDLEDGVPEELGHYDMIVSCEGIEHIANPGLFLKSARNRLNPGGTIIVTTPNTWHPAARLKYFLRGFFPGFPSPRERSNPEPICTSCRGPGHSSIYISRWRALPTFDFILVSKRNARTYSKKILPYR